MYADYNIWLNQSRETEFNEDISSGLVLEDSFGIHSQYQDDSTAYVSDSFIGGSTSEDGCNLEIGTHVGEFIDGDYTDKMSSISFRESGWSLTDEIFQKGLAYEHDYSPAWSNDETNDLFIPSISKVKEMIANSGNGNISSDKLEKSIDGYIAQVKFPDNATADSHWVFPQAYSSKESPIYVPLEINGSVASSGGSVSVGMQGVLNASSSDGMITAYDRLNFYIPDTSLDIYPNIFTYNNTSDEMNFTTVGGVRNDGRTYGPDAIDDNDYVTKSQLEEQLAGNTSPFISIDEGNGPGYVISGRDPDNYGFVGSGAFDISHSPDESPEMGALGDYSFAAGLYSNAQGDYSFAAGVMNKAKASGSAAFGEACTIESGNSFAAGSQVSISGGGVIIQPLLDMVLW